VCAKTRSLKTLALLEKKKNLLSLIFRPLPLFLFPNNEHSPSARSTSTRATTSAFWASTLRSSNS